MGNSNAKRLQQLGMPHGTAAGKLRKKILFNLLKKYGENICFQCNKEIEIEEELSIEHKVPYLNSENPVKLFFDFDNIGFSHLVCNIKAMKRPNQVLFQKIKYRGVIFPDDRHTMFRYCYSYNGETIYVTGFENAMEAALAYDKKVIELFGENAITNKLIGLV